MVVLREGAVSYERGTPVGQGRTRSGADFATKRMSVWRRCILIWNQYDLTERIG